MNRPTPISAFSDQRRTKSTTRSHTSCGTQIPVRVPQDFFWRDVLSHQLSQNLVLGLHLLLQELNPFLLLLHLAVGTLLRLKGSRPVLEELLLPAVKHRRPQAQFFTQVRDRHLVQKMPPQDRYFLFCAVMLPFFPHTFAPLSYRRNAFSISNRGRTLHRPRFRFPAGRSPLVLTGRPMARAFG